MEPSRGLRVRAETDVLVSYNCFYVADLDIAGPETPYFDSNGLVVSQTGIAVIATGIHTGKIALSVEIYDETPPVETADWQEIVEVPLEAIRGQMTVTAPTMGGPENFPVLTPHGPGGYRLRVHARGRDAANRYTGTEPAENYLLQIWPAPTAPEIIHKQTDSFGATRRRRHQEKRERYLRNPPKPPPQRRYPTGQ